MKLVYVAVVALLLCAAVAAAGDHGVVVQGWLPEEADGQNWGDGYEGPKNELWNDCFLAYEMFCSRPGMDSAHSRIKMLWGKGYDYRRLNDERYDPERRFRNQGITTITDDSACVATVESTFALLAGVMGSDDTLFCYTWGHGGHDDTAGGEWPNQASHFSIGVRPLGPPTPIWDTAFGRMANAVNAKRVFIMQQCYSGGFIDDLSDSATYLLCASAAGKSALSADNRSKRGSPWPEHEGIGSDTFRHAEFSFHLLNALRGKVPWPLGSTDSLHPARADYNGDGVVSWEEAFVYADSFESQNTGSPVMHRPDSFWVVKASMPPTQNKKVSDGGALAALVWPDTVTRIFATKGCKTNQFWAYWPDGDSWTSLESVPTGDRKKVTYGATLAAGYDGRLYLTVGGKRYQFWVYDIEANTWGRLPDIPAGPANKRPGRGAASAAVVVGDTVFVYFLKGNKSSEFYRYNSVTGQWAELTDPPGLYARKGFKDGSCMAWDGKDTIYVLRGKYNEFLAYSVAGGTWKTNLAYLPLNGRAARVRKARAGSGLACYAGKVFALKGRSNEFWVYYPKTDSWSQAQDLIPGPSGKLICGKGGALAYADGFLWVLKGKRTCDFLRFTPGRYGPMSPPQEQPGPGPNELQIAAGSNAQHPSWSRSGQWISYCREDSVGVAQVFKAPASGGSEVKLTNLAGECDNPVWSPDDSKIAFETDVDGNTQIAVAGTDVVVDVLILTSDSRDHRRPVWSPSGGFLVYEKDDSTGFTHLYSVPVSGGAEVQITTSAYDHEFPGFLSPTTLVFQRGCEDGFIQLFKLILGGSVETQLTTTATDHERPAPGLGAVYCEVVDNDGFSQIAWVPVQGGQERVLTSGQYDFEAPTVSPDDSVVFCTMTAGDGSALCQVNPQGGYVPLTADDVDREHPSAYASGTTGVSCAYVRHEGVFRTIEGGSGGQGAGMLALSLDEIAPNPVRDRLTVSWSLNRTAEVSLRVFNAAGRLVRTLLSARSGPGRVVTVWNGCDDAGRRLAQGVYVVRLDADGEQLAVKTVLLK